MKNGTTEIDEMLDKASQEASEHSEKVREAIKIMAREKTDRDSGVSRPKLVLAREGYFCEKCKSLCHKFKNGMICNCHFVGQSYSEKVYPKNWIKVKISAEII